MLNLRIDYNQSVALLIRINAVNKLLGVFNTLGDEAATEIANLLIQEHFPGTQLMSRYSSWYWDFKFDSEESLILFKLATL